MNVTKAYNLSMFNELSSQKETERNKACHGNAKRTDSEQILYTIHTPRTIEQYTTVRQALILMNDLFLAIDTIKHSIENGKMKRREKKK